MVLIPHVPNTISFSDVYAMHIPIFLPSEPEIWTWTWSQSDPYGGPGFLKKQQSAPWSLAVEAPDWVQAAGGNRHHTYHAFGHLEEPYAKPEYFEARAYWFQYTEYHLLPHTRSFRGVAHLMVQLLQYSKEDALEDSRRMAQEQAKRETH
eukprot:6462577-Amphidinium_carterae.1